MESLGSVLKKLPLSHRRQQAEAKIEELLQHPVVQEWWKQHPDIDQRTMRMNINKLYQYVKEHDGCSNCPSLGECRNDMPGHFTKLSATTLNGRVIIDDRKVPCQRQAAHDIQQAVRKRVRSFFVDETALKQGYSAAEMITIDYERGPAVQQVMDYVMQAKEHGLTSRGLYLSGSFGTGKTFLMGYMLHKLAQENHSGVIVYMPDFVEDLKSMFQEPQRLRETIEMMKETDLLVFDDIGAENMTPWVRDHVLGSILNYRMNNKPTFFTSNYDFDALLRHFSYTREGEDVHKAERLMDRIRPYVDVVQVSGRNKRGGSGSNSDNSNPNHYI
ncbi:primosomal protein DnaI [Paenibacillus arenosi]|uniref:Primosomal protein DnaI n=1 Tax=Paenibacillus arenosi TaxID=2774142 RepID=A0ABR9AYD4_9BACL|nr:primosomal protein DnaI [Paenibacillus arenosi]MBD8499094.1 primosomal protein DnaI [Paenibacillus arenosi]